MIVKNEHFYKDLNRTQIKNSFQNNIKRKKSIIPIILEDNYNGLLYRMKKHYFQHHET